MGSYEATIGLVQESLGSEHRWPSDKSDTDPQTLVRITLLPRIPPIYALIKVNNKPNSTSLEPKMTYHWKADLFLMLGYSSVTALLAFVVMHG